LQTLTDGLTFDAASHVYTLGGVVLPSVTTVLGRVYPENWEHCGEFAKERGSNVHEMIDLYLGGDLDEDFLAPSVEGYLRAAQSAIAEMGLSIEGHELRMASLTHGIAGTADIVGTVARKKPTLAIVDWGTGDKGWAGGLQTAAYASMYQENTGRTPLLRFAVHLKADGQYAVTEYKSREDLPEFLAALRVYRRKAA